MARPKKGSLPAYRHHKARNCAVVTIDGKDHYLGPYDTPSSKQKYAALIRSWQQRQELPNASPNEPLLPNDRPTVNELILAFLKYADAHYKPNNGENKEAGCIDDALKVVQQCGYGNQAADDFRPKDLKKVREAMTEKGWSRNYINSQVNRVKRMFQYAVEEDVISGSVYHALLAVRGLRRGAPGVRETKRVRPVRTAHLKTALEMALGSSQFVLRAMILFAYRTGARPGEVCALKPCFLHKVSKVWVYRVPPEANKTDHHDQERKVFIGPRARKTLNPMLKGLRPGDYVFSPVRAEAQRQESRRSRRKTPLWPSHVRRQEEKKKTNPKRAKRDHYDPVSFRRAVKRLCDQAGVPRWTPNQLRHNVATRFRKRFGIEVARILLGHRKLQTTEIYAEVDLQTARKAARKLG
jgi:integrase